MDATFPSHPSAAASPSTVPLDQEAFEGVVEAQWFEAEVPRKTLKALMQRSDAKGWANFGPWAVLLLAAAAWIAAVWDTPWAWLALFVYGTLYCSSDARWHELAHGTPFRSQSLNRFWYEVCSFLTIRESVLWRWSHTRHHTHTLLIGRDPEVQVMRPPRLFPIIADFFYVFGGSAEILRIVRHAFGVIPPEVADFVPESERPRMVRNSRIYLLLVAAVIGSAIACHSWIPLLLVWTPRFYCGWFHQLLGLMQHAGMAQNVHDHRLNSRTVHVNPVFAFLYMNMQYHIEHHMMPMVPFHALPELHRAVAAQCPPAYPSVWSVYREMIPTLLRQRRDPSWYIRRELPARG